MSPKPITYLAGSPDGQIHVKKSTRAVGGVEVLVRVTHSGVCGTDAHDRTAGCGLGHEGVGFVEGLGSEVTSVKLGQRVGWGWQFASCGHCRECVDGYRQYCSQAVGQKYGELEQGAFGDYVVKHQDFVYSIPDEVESKYAAPLNCAGITVYEALDVADTRPSDRVGICGLGGLGHVAVMYARAMGCHVSVFSSSKEKRADALAMGASEFHVLGSEEQSAPAASPNIDVMLLCGGSLSDLEFLMPLLSRRARIVLLVIQGGKLAIPYLPFILPGHRLIASTEASRRNHIDAFTFAARHNIKPWVEEYPMSKDGLTEALDDLDKGSVRYRAVLSTERGTKFE